MKNFGTVIAITLCTGSLIGPPAQAEQIVSRTEVVVPYGDLNLSSSAGAHELIDRLEAAASKVCGMAPDLRSLGPYHAYHDCRKQALNRAVSDVHSPLVSELYGTPLVRAAEIKK